MTWQPGDDQPPLAPPAEVSVADRGSPERPASGTTVELCVRSLSDEVQPLFGEALRRLRGAEAVNEVAVAVCGRSFDPTGPAAATEPGRALADRLESFRDWADENGASFGRFFRARTVERLAGEPCTRIELPTVTLAEYREDDLAFVTPCHLGERHYTVLDGVRRLTADDRTTPAIDRVGERAEPAGEDGTTVRT
jgi:hypothetical protein